jgi:putative DNA primase/helicase
MEFVRLYCETSVAAAAATLDQIENALEQQAHFNITYCINRHLAAVIPNYPESERQSLSEEIALTCNGEGVVVACRRFANELLKQSSVQLSKRHSRNDVGNGERFAAENGHDFKFLHDRKTWVKWDGKRWCDAPESVVARVAKKTVMKMLEEALRDDDKEAQAWALSSLSRKGISNMIACASNERIFEAKTSDFDQHLDLLTVDNGTIDLRTGALRPHDRLDMITKLTPIRYDTNSECPRWLQFLEEIFSNEDLIAFVHRGFGYSLTGHTREHAFFLLWGSGRNGKGRFITVLRAMLGDAARTTQFQTFTIGRFSEGERNTPALASLAGARLVTAGEPDHSVKFSESVIKSLTGEDEIEVCHKYERPFTFIPRFKIWLHTNYKPQIRGTDEGVWSRPRLIPFTTIFMTEEEAAKKKIDPAKRRDPDRRLDAKLEKELPGILAWAVRGAVGWYKNGLGTCKTVDDATEGYREESDELGLFVEARIKIEPSKFTTNEALYSAYESWCKGNGVRPLESNWLSRELVARGYKRGKSNKDERGFKDISLIAIRGLL